MEHRYGGPWTEIKLEAIEKYLSMYSTALNKIFHIWYIDAFAGTGSRDAEITIGGILEDAPVSTSTIRIDGSARRALAVKPNFHEFVFIEKDAGRRSALEKLAQSARKPFNANIKVLSGDANAELKRMVAAHPWTGKSGSWNRGVVFLDPYALELDWTTLQELAATKRLDVWYLFPTMAVTRLLAHDYERAEVNEGHLDRVLGREWRELYSFEPSEQMSIFDHPQEDKAGRRAANQFEIEAWFKRRLEKEFAYVSDPLPLLTGRGRKLFSLFLAVGNPEPKAKALARKFAKEVTTLPIHKASHPKSGL